MATALISSSISTQVLTFKPGGAPASFEVTVSNDSDQFASFQIEVLAPGADQELGDRWYNLYPEVSSKKPPGDSTTFTVVITDAPVPGFVGTMNLTVRIFSLELRHEERQVLRLILEPGTVFVPVKLELPVKEFQAYPNDRVEVPVRVYNPSQHPANVVLSLTGIAPAWLPEGVEERLQLKPQGRTEVTFICQVPGTTETRCQDYPFTIAATQPEGQPTSVHGKINIGFTGFLDFRCVPSEQEIPLKGKWLLTRWRSRSALYHLEFENCSNLPQHVSAFVQGKDLRRCRSTIQPESADVSPGETVTLQLEMTPKRRRWLGIGRRRLVFAAKAQVSDQRLDVRNDTQLVELLLTPVIHPLTQLLLLLLLLCLAWSESYLNPDNPRYGHQAAVNSVQFSGFASQVISSSDDQTLMRWRTLGFQNPLTNQHIETIGKTNKAVRVVRYKPVENDLIAAGLENGEIQLWDYMAKNKKLLDSFFYQRDDRVFDLEFTTDSKSLFSGHGSGWVLQWDVESPGVRELDAVERLLRRKKVDFAVYNLALVGQAGTQLAIAGRYNQLLLWDWQTDKLTKIDYRAGGQDDYIVGLATAENKPDLLATADNQGYITLWNLRPCLAGTGTCQVLDQWRDGHNNQPVRSVALNANGCYLASGGDDARVMLWTLDPEGKRDPQFLKGLPMGTSFDKGKFNTVDIKTSGHDILVASGSDDSQVRVHRAGRQPQSSCDRF